jgi:hypothetical protein
MRSGKREIKPPTEAEVKDAARVLALDIVARLLKHSYWGREGVCEAACEESVKVFEESINEQIEWAYKRLTGDLED